MNRYFMHIGIITSIVVFFTIYYIVDRVMIRAYQLAENTLDVDYESRALPLAAGITVVYLILYWIFIKDLFGNKGEGQEEAE